MGHCVIGFGNQDTAFDGIVSHSYTRKPVCIYICPGIIPHLQAPFKGMEALLDRKPEDKISKT